jgi:raffinose/stachyose/melibiose transport system permease protein
MQANVTRTMNSRATPYFYVLPALLVCLFIIISPLFISLVLSFFDFSGYDRNFFKKFVGLDNFRTLFRDRYFWIALRNTLFFTASVTTVQVAVALFFAIIIFFGNFRNGVLLRTIIFVPGVLAPVSISLAWRKILEQGGVLNSILNIDFSWLSSVQLAIWIVIFVSIWQWMGYNMLILYAGLQSLDIQMLEAADMDGASWTRKIFAVVIPSVVPTIVLNVVINVISAFRVFDIVYVLTRGGPVHNSEVLTTLMYYYSFSANGPNKMGVGSAIAMILFVVMVAFGVIRTSMIRRGRKG